ncbi:amino-acid N-acetyltransferase [Cardiobacteriaceae bacterium TAE3-ERU3]|nr:amino-acid N-acetyltransferase [Cardiobacteriaceae bacterium TAE3-ERU3]
MTSQSFLPFFRQAAPYIHAHRKKTFVIAFDGDLAHPHLKKLLHDCALLHSLNINLVLVHGARQQIDAHLERAGISSTIFADKRITTRDMMPYILDAVGSLRLRIEAALSMSMVNSPMQGASVRVASGNFLTAKPVGVQDGHDFGLAGIIRRIDHEAIRQQLNLGNIVLLSPLGYSPTGELYNLNAEEVAAHVAVTLKTDKLIYVTDAINAYTRSGQSRQLTPAQANIYDDPQQPWLRQRLHAAAKACEAGVRRVHLIERDNPEALLLELFTRDGDGIMVTTDHYDNLRQATIDDIGGLLDLIRPLEAQGVLVKRSREHLEMEIEHFYVLERDHTIIGCAALYPYPEEASAELACVVVHPDYRKNNRADHLLEALEQEAQKRGIEKLFILTTQTAQWFEERGFALIGIEELPVGKRQTYNYQRNSRPYLKIL